VGRWRRPADHPDGDGWTVAEGDCEGSSAFDLAYADAVLRGEAAADWAGHAVSGAGDVDVDGLDDVLVGVISNGASGERAGAAYLLRYEAP